MSVLAILLIGSLITIYNYGVEINDNSNRTNAPIVLKEYEGGLAAFLGDDVIEVFPDVIVATLPEYDKNALKKGIAFENMDKVYIALEDYDG